METKVVISFSWIIFLILLTIYVLTTDARQSDALDDLRKLKKKMMMSRASASQLYHGPIINTDEILNSQARSKEAGKINESPGQPREADRIEDSPVQPSEADKIDDSPGQSRDGGHLTPDRSGCTTDETGRCKVDKSLPDDIRYCNSPPLNLRNCKDEVCGQYCSNKFDPNRSNDASGKCKDPSTCVCRYPCV